MKKFVGKKILFLGSNVGTIDMIRYAKQQGAYTIVADYLPKEKSLGKQVSDDEVLISTGDLETLKQYVQDKHIDGVFAGVSEFNLLNAMKLCRHFNFPFYCTKEQWDSIEDKEMFRNLCKKYRVPCPNTYFTGSELSEDVYASITYPVVIKPVDSSSSMGVSICRDLNSLVLAIPEAKKNSAKGRFIVEEFFEGEEFTAHYTIANGVVTLSCVDNRIPIAIHEGDVTTIPVARLYPSSFIGEYIKQVNDKVVNLCKSLEMNMGVLFVQGLYNKPKNRFSIFEAGLRSAGEAPYRIIENVNGISFMNLFVDYALLGKVENYNLEKEDPFLKGKVCCVASFVSKGGRVGRVFGYDEIMKNVPSIIDRECRYQEGEDTPSGNTLRQIMLRFVLVCDSFEQMICDVETINSSVTVLNDMGEDMCYRFDARNYLENRKRME